VVGADMSEPKLHGRPDKIFVSVDESTRKSTLSFQPSDSGEPYQYEDDLDGQRALDGANAIIARYPGCSISGPHFHAARPPRARPRPRRPAP
jgi:hypothetical protein